MNVSSPDRTLTNRLVMAVTWRFRTQSIRSETFPRISRAPREPRGRLEKIAAGPLALPFEKAWHYLEIYDEIFELLRARKGDAPIGVIELGVRDGGSLILWSRFFGESATVFGIDINPECANHKVGPASIRIGSQTDSHFLTQVVGEMGGVDVVIDDGSHRARDTLASLEILFPLLNDGGIYVIEDLRTSYWPEFGGGVGRRRTPVGFIRQLIDGLHFDYFEVRGVAPQALWASMASEITSISIYNSMAVLRKGKAPRLERFSNQGLFT
jgi:hypothetical protein